MERVIGGGTEWNGSLRAVLTGSFGMFLCLSFGLKILKLILHICFGFCIQRGNGGCSISMKAPELWLHQFRSCFGWELESRPWSPWAQRAWFLFWNPLSSWFLAKFIACRYFFHFFFQYHFTCAEMMLFQRHLSDYFKMKNNILRNSRWPGHS